MKRLVSIFLTLIIICSVLSFSADVFAEELKSITVQRPQFPLCYPKPERVMLRAVSNPIESVILDAWENAIEGQIDVSGYRLTPDEITEIFFNLLYSNPKYYYAKAVRCYYNEYTNLTVYIEVLYTETDKTVIAKTLNEIEKATDDILIYIDDDMTDFEKVMTVHNRMIAEYDYNYDATKEGYDETKGDFDVRIMAKKTGVCQGYALAFKYVMNKLSIDCIFVRSLAMKHGWNLVKVDGQWYHIDLTWDDLGNGYFTGIENTYALLSDNAIQNLQSPHYNYDSLGVEADSTAYDNAIWRHTNTPVISIDGISYYMNEGSLVSSIDEKIYEGFGYWNLEKPDGTVLKKYFVGLFEYNGLLYFNSGTNVYCYNPKTKERKAIGNGYPISNIDIKRNHMNVMLYDFDNKTNVLSASVLLSGARIGKPVLENGRIKVYIYKEDSTPLNVFCSYTDKVVMQKLLDAEMNKVYFDSEEDVELFYWDDEMCPLRDKETVNIY